MIKKVVIAALVLSSLNVFAKDHKSARQVAQVDSAQFVSQRSASIGNALAGMTDGQQESVARALKLSTKGTNAYQAILDLLSSSDFKDLDTIRVEQAIAGAVK